MRRYIVTTKQVQEEIIFECNNCGHKFIDEEDWAGSCDEHSCFNCECDCSDCAEDEEED